MKSTASTSTKLYSVSSLMLSFLFAYSASVQLDDHDWYLWLPLYASATIVNLVQGIWLTPRMGFVARFGLGLGVCLLVKVVAEDAVYSLAGFWSLDLSERVVREKVGSGLVVVSMLLQLKVLDSESTLSFRKGQRMRTGIKVSNSVHYGMGMLVAFAYGLPIAFFAVQKGQLKFDA